MKRRLWALLLLIGIVLLAACSGGEEASSTSSALTVKVEDEFRYEPATLSVKAGQAASITFENSGSVEHTFNILKADAELEHVLGEEDEEHLHEELLLDIHEVAPGESATETFTAPDTAGDYTVACLVPGHAEAGMVGTLQVTQ